MDERVSRRGIFQQLFINGVDAVGGLLSETGQPELTPDEAGHLLRSRKTGKKDMQFHAAHRDTENAPAANPPDRSESSKNPIKPH